MCTWAEFRAVLKCDGVPPEYGSCHSLMPELLTLGEETFFYVFFNLAHPNSAFLSPLCRGVPEPLDAFFIACTPEGRVDICYLQFGSLGGQQGLAGGLPVLAAHAKVPCLVVDSISHMDFQYSDPVQCGQDLDAEVFHSLVKEFEAGLEIIWAYAAVGKIHTRPSSPISRGDSFVF